eukprot:4935992-Ditylum_brightwellii.AAC.1
MMCADGSREPKSKSPHASLVLNTTSTYDVEEIVAGCEEEEMGQKGSGEQNSAPKGENMVATPGQ